MTPQQQHPPKLPLRFFRWFCHPKILDYVEGDLMEVYERRIKESGKGKADLRFIVDVLLLFRPGIIKPIEGVRQIENYGMIKSYFKIAVRVLSKRKLYSFINVFGLSISMSCCLLIYLFIQDERHFDGFHVNKNLIFRIEDKKFNIDNPGAEDPYTRSASLPAGLKQVLLDEIPEVTHATRFNSGYSSVLRYGEKVFAERVTYVDRDFFTMFSFPLIAGNSQKIFMTKAEVVLTPSVARKYFGDEDPIGKTVLIGSSEPGLFTVTGIIEGPPANSSLDFSILLPQENRGNYQKLVTLWTDSNSPTFIQLAADADLKKFKRNLSALMQKYQADRLERWEKARKEASFPIPSDITMVSLDFTALPDMHLKKETEWYKVSDPIYSKILGGIGLLILVVSCINYISLALTMSSTRRKEVGVRKVVGVNQRQLLSQFVTESMMLISCSLIIGFTVVILVLPAFNEFTGRQIALEKPDLGGFIFAGFALALIGLIAGLYPVVVVSRFRPALVLKGSAPRVHAGITKPLVLLQFALSSSLIIAATVMNRQMQFVATKDLGYSQEAILVVGTQSGWNDEANKTVERFRTASRTERSIVSVSGTSSTFDGGTWSHDFPYQGEKITAFLYAVDPYYIETLGLELLHGRNFDASIASDTNAIIINEAMVRALGWTNPLDETLPWRKDVSDAPEKVIGVVKDYHYLPLNHKIDPVILSINKRKVGYYGVMHIRISVDDIPGAVATVEQVWKKIAPDKPFAYSFLDEKLAMQYKQYRQWTTLMSIATVLAIAISCLGLFGLSGINTVNRTKEIGIRKVLGAGLEDIFVLMNKQYIWMAVAAFALAAPICGYVMNQWLSTFQFRITLSWEIFGLSMMAGLCVTLLAVSYHTIKTALMDPSNTLRTE
jgi:putative ABC transport system permease protein